LPRNGFFAGDYPAAISNLSFPISIFTGVNPMRTYTILAILLLALTLTAAQCGAAPQATTAEIKVMEPYARAGLPNGAVFMQVMNQGDKDDALLSAQTDVAKAVELHESKIDENGVMKMSPVPNIPVPAGGSATLKPGGLHVMLMGLQKELAVGDKFTLTLTFKEAGPQTIDVEVTESMMAQTDHTTGEMKMDGMEHGQK
jgi:copper(I)-binding protein